MSDDMQDEDGTSSGRCDVPGFRPWWPEPWDEQLTGPQVPRRCRLRPAMAGATLPASKHDDAPVLRQQEQRGIRTQALVPAQGWAGEQEQAWGACQGQAQGHAGQRQRALARSRGHEQRALAQGGQLPAGLLQAQQYGAGKGGGYGGEPQPGRGPAGGSAAGGLHLDGEKQPGGLEPGLVPGAVGHVLPRGHVPGTAIATREPVQTGGHVSGGACLA